MRAVYAIAAVLLAGFVIPESVVIPVEGATRADWNPKTFWHEPWGKSGVHKGIDIFADVGVPVLASTGGVVVFTGEWGRGGNAVLILGSGWRLHYYAHLDSITTNPGRLVSSGEPVGTVGNTGNAADRPPHLHYGVLSILPRPWAMTRETQGWKRMFFLNPDARL